jgi:hypothetical protein
LFAVLVLIAGACGGPSASPSPSPTPATAWERVLDEITPEGEITRETALRMFALVHGPMPGVQVPEGPRELVPSGTLATRSLISHWDAITDEQRAAATRYLRSGIEEPLAGTAALFSFAGAECVTQGDDAPPALVATFLAAAHEAETFISDHLPGKRKLTATIEVVLNDEKEGDYAAQAVPRTTDCNWVGDLERCIIQVNPAAQAYEAKLMRPMVAHEVFHCFQMDLLPIETDRVAWIEEGSASWVGYEFVDGDSYYWRPQWQEWLTSPGKELYARAYDAVGFFAHLQDSGVSPWSVIDEMQKRGHDGDEAYLTAVAAGPERVVEEWGPGLVRDPAHAPVWDQAGGGIPSDRYELLSFAISNGVRETLLSPRLAAQAGRLGLSAEVVVFTATGARGRVLFSDGVELPLSVVDGRPMCTLPGGCVCPPGGRDAEFGQTATGPAFVGFAGHLTGMTIVVDGYSLDEYCGAAPTPTFETAPPGTALAPTPRPTVSGGPATAFVSGVGALTGGFCEVRDVPSEGFYQWEIFFGDLVTRNFYTMSMIHPTPITAGTYTNVMEMGSTIRQGDFYHNVRIRQLTLEGGPGPSGEAWTGGGFFVGEYNDKEQVGWIIAGHFDCNGALEKRDFVLGWPMRQTLLPDLRATDMVINAQSAPDGTNPSGTISIEVGEEPRVVKGNLIPWATVVCVTVLGGSDGLSGRDEAGLVALTTVPFGDIPAGTYVGFEGQQIIDGGPQDQYGVIAETANDPFGLAVVASADTCAPGTLPRTGLGHFTVHDEP